MSVTYEYTRNYSNGKYDLENDVIPDGDEVDILPALTIEAAFPGINFKLLAAHTVYQCIFDTALDAGQKTTLDGIIAAARKF